MVNMNFSCIIGFSHNSDYQLFRLGETASSAIQEFAETGGTTTLEKLQKEVRPNNVTNATTLTSGADLVLDGFTAPPIDKGVGISEANIFLDGNHSMVSKIYK